MKTGGIGIGSAPHIFEVRSSSGSMWLLSLCLLAPVLQSSLTDGFSSLLIAAVSVASALFVELLLELLSGKRESYRNIVGTDGSVVASALALALMMPNTIHPLVPAVGAAFSAAVIKKSFGGLGSNWLNPAAGAWLLLRFNWEPLFGSSLDRSSASILSASVAKGLSDPSGSPLAVLKIGGWKPSPADERATVWLNDTFLSFFGAQMPAGYIDFFASSAPGLIVERGFLLFLCATVVLIASRLIRWQLPLSFLVAYIAAVRVWGGLPYGGALFTGDMVFASLSGTVVLAAYVLIADPGTGCKTKGAGLLAAAAAGLLAFFFRFNGADAYGALLAVPAANLIIAVIRMAERRFYFTPRGKR